MADKDLESEKLELSLFRRKRKKSEQSTSGEAAPDAPPATPTEPEADATPTVTSDPAPPAEPVRAATPEPAPVAPAATARPASSPAATQVQEPVPTTQEQPAAPPPPGRRRAGGARVAPKTPRESRLPQVPAVAGGLAALVVGAVVGLAAVGLTFASLRLCELLTGTDSCGGPGLLVLLAVVTLMVLGGTALLKMAGVPDAGGLSFLGVAMFVAICLVVLLPSLLEVWMIVVAPVLCALTFVIAHWIVTRFDEDVLERDVPPPHDVR